MTQELNGQLMPLPAGTVAPDFTLQHTFHTHLSLASLCDNPVILVFYPSDWEPVSREQLTLYQEYAGEFARYGASLIGISVDQTWSHAAFAADARLGFPLLADFQPRGAVARMYGVYRPREGVSARALFVLDRRGIIRFGQVYPDQLDPGVDGILTTLEFLPSANLP
jgi:peroxiredoxin